MIELSLLTWNINQWPAALGAGHNRRRLEQVSAHIRDFDIVCLQECWSSAAREIRWQFPHHFLDDGRSAIGFGSGLLTLSKFPVELGRFTRYCAAAVPDSLAAKGVSLARLVVPGAGPLHVINTHLQARYWPGVRARQMAELDRFVARHTDGACTLLAGDLNAQRTSGEFQQLHRALGFSEALELEPLAPAALARAPRSRRFTGDGQRIDHILLLAGAKSTLHVLESGVIDDEVPGEERISDHRGLFVRIGVEAAR